MLLRLTVLFVLLINISFVSAQKNEYLPENLGPNINSACDELFPIIAPNGQTLYFCRGECEGGYGGQDIWFSILDPQGKWTKAVNMESPLNNKFNNFVCSVSPDGNTLLLGNVYSNDGSSEKGISITHKTEKGWSEPEKVIINDYYNLNINANFFLANDGHTLLMTIERKDSYGKRDIYVSFLEKDGTWSKPLNIGLDVNTAGDEISPFLASDDVSLYFSTDGREGFGSADVFMTKRLDESWTKWSKPINLGATVNTPGWDAYYKITAQGDYAYFVSESNSFGKSDIFRVKLPENVRPNPVILVKGKIINYKTYAPILASINYKTLNENKVAGIARSNAQDGKYEITLPSGSVYNYSGEAPDFVSANWTLDVTKLTKYKELVQNLELIPASDSIFCIRNVFFAKNKADLSTNAKSEIDKGIEFLQKNNDCVVEVAGHTDSTGSMDINIKLAEKRCSAVSDYIKASGITSDKILPVAVGTTKPAWSNETEEGRQLNRRVEFLVFRKK